MLDNVSILFNCILIFLVCVCAVRQDPDVKRRRGDRRDQ